MSSQRLHEDIVRLLLLLLLLLTPLPIVAQSNAGTGSPSAGEMLSYCRPISDAKVEGGMIHMPKSFDTGVCWGAFAAVQPAAAAVNQNGVSLFGACPPEDARRSDIVAVYVEFVSRHPERRHEYFFWVAIDAMKQAYPCKAARR